MTIYLYSFSWKCYILPFSKIKLRSVHSILENKYAPNINGQNHFQDDATNVLVDAYIEAIVKQNRKILIALESETRQSHCRETWFNLPFKNSFMKKWNKTSWTDWILAHSWIYVKWNSMQNDFIHVT